MGKQLRTFRRKVLLRRRWSKKTTMRQDAATFSSTSLYHGLYLMWLRQGWIFFLPILRYFYSKCYTTGSLVVVFVANAVRSLCSLQISLRVTSWCARVSCFVTKLKRADGEMPKNVFSFESDFRETGNICFNPVSPTVHVLRSKYIRCTVFFPTCFVTPGVPS